MVNNNTNSQNEKEVIKKTPLSGEKSTMVQPKEEDMGFKELYEQSLSQLQYGDVTRGTVVLLWHDVYQTTK